MTRKLEPNWTKSQLKAGQKMSQAWEAFFSEADQEDKAAGEQVSRLSEGAQFEHVLHRHEAELLERANVVGVATGWRTRQGRPSQEPCIIVYVRRKVSEADLSAEDLVPKEIEGVPTDVVEVGDLKAL